MVALYVKDCCLVSKGEQLLDQPKILIVQIISYCPRVFDVMQFRWMACNCSYVLRSAIYANRLSVATIDKVVHYVTKFTVAC